MQQPASPAPQIGSKTLKIGDTLLKPNDKLTSVYVIKSGLIGLFQNKNEKNIRISELGPPTLIGEEAVFGPAKWNLHAVALRDTSLIEIPVAALTDMIGKLHKDYQAIVQGVYERVKITSSELKSLKSNQETESCPPDNTAKVFGVIYHVAKIIGNMDDKGQTCLAEKDSFMKFATQVMHEDPARLESAMQILAKLNYLKFQEGGVELLDMKQIEAFFDFYGTYHFKGGYSGWLKTNAKVQRIVDCFLGIASRYPIDRAGNCHVPFKETIDEMKKTLTGFQDDQLFALEQKGLFMKRTQNDKGGILSFYKPDYDQMLLNWKILREIELWNEKGYVDMTPPPPPPAPVDPAAAAAPAPATPAKK
ncbi:MAG: cyclic nucleotide-binding domain-containing protein [Xanthomonadaceae bacterium]|nr:cyclic nucleotide-binding domain-containing protein [Xanthomonadaceae bacterium]